MKRINAANYQKDQLYSAVAREVSKILETSNVVTPVEVLLRWLALLAAMPQRGIAKQWHNPSVPLLGGGRRQPIRREAVPRRTQA